MTTTGTQREDRTGAEPPSITSGWPLRHALSGAILAGGALGAVARLTLDELIPTEPGRWPWATFIANLVGCALLGYLATRLLERLPPSTYRRPLLGTGLCGALTTFSSLQVEAISLSKDGHAGVAVAYVGSSILAGLACIAIASALVRRARVGPA